MHGPVAVLVFVIKIGVASNWELSDLSPLVCFPGLL